MHRSEGNADLLANVNVESGIGFLYLLPCLGPAIPLQEEPYKQVGAV